MTILRSLLFVPGNKANMLDKALGLDPDAFVPDMEDSVPAAEKANARETVAKFLPKLAARGTLVIPRVNALDTDWFEPDVAAVVGPDIFGISIGKVRTAADISEISQALADHEQRSGLIIGHLKLVAVDRDGRGHRELQRDLPGERTYRRRRIRRRGFHERHGNRAPRGRVAGRVRAASICA